MSERQIELTWRCSTCAHPNLGRHMACQSCGHPKDDSEEYEMPADPSVVASVEDPALLRLANAGENWACAYCGSDQRDLDGGCRQCGAGRKEGANAAPAPVREELADLPPDALPKQRRFRVVHGVLGAIVGVTLCFVACFALDGSSRKKTATPAATAVVKPLRTDFDAKVTGLSWKRTITIEKWQLAPHGGFTTEVPVGAIDVRAAGQHVHHHEDVFDHDETVYDSVEVPDGYRTETYSARESCGEDCTTTPRRCKQVCTRSTRTCRQVCTNKKNGFASCRDQCSGGEERCREDCSGGDRKCTTKYCNVTKTRQVPKTRTEKRPRVVKKYRSEPRYAAWSTFKTWEWVKVRSVEDSGNEMPPLWPDAGRLAVDAGLATAVDGGPKAGAEREQRNEQLNVTITTDEGHAYPYTPATEEELGRLTSGAPFRVRVINDGLTIL